MSDDTTSGLDSEISVRLLFASNYVLLRDLLAARFAETPRIELVGSSELGTSLLQLISELRPDVTLLSLRLGASSNSDTELVSSILKIAPATKMVVMSAAFLPGQISLLSQAGVDGLLLESQDWPTLVETVFAVHRGAFVASSSIARAGMSIGQLPQDGLTSTEVSLMELVSEGLQNRAIASRLNVSVSTVRSRISNVLEKLGSANRTQAVTEAIRQGYISLSR